MIIYKTTCLINKKLYIGLQTNDDKNYLGSGKNIKLAIKKYGKHNFVKETIDIADTLEQLQQKEIYWIAFYNSTNSKIGYNITAGGDSGHKLTKQHIKKLIKANKRKKGTKASIATCVQMSKTMKKKIMSHEHKQKLLSNPNKMKKGDKHSVESINKMRQKQLNRPKSCCVLCHKEMDIANMVRHVERHAA